MEPRVLNGLTAPKLIAAVNDDYRALDNARKIRQSNYARWRTRHHPFAQTVVNNVDPAARRPVNLSNQQIRTIVTHTAHQRGVAEIQPRRAGIDVEAALWQMVADDDSDRSSLIDTIQTLIVDTILSGASWLDTGLRAGRGVIKASDGDADPGETYTKLRTLDDYAIDCTVRRHTDASREGIRYRVSRAEAIEGRYLGLQPWESPFASLACTPEEAAAVLAALPKVDAQRHNQRTQATTNLDGAGWNLDEQIELWDVFLYCRGETFVATIAGGESPTSAAYMGGQTKLLHIERYDGPGRSRLTRCAFIEDPESVIPTSLEGHHADIAAIADLLAIKGFNQALRMKRNTIVRPGAEALSKAMESAADQEHVFGDPKDVTQVVSAGMVAEALEAYRAATGVWDQQSGAVALTGGLRGPDSDKTATAFQGLMAMASGYLQFLQSRVNRVASDELTKRMKLKMGDPLAVHNLGYRLEDDLMVDVEWTPQMRRGRYEDFTFRIRAGSMPFDDPATSARRAIELFTQTVPAILQTSATFGLDPKPMLRRVGQRTGEPTLHEIVPDAEILLARQAAAQAAGQPARANVTGTIGPGAGVMEADGKQNAIDETRSAMSRRVPA